MHTLLLLLCVPIDGFIKLTIFTANSTPQQHLDMAEGGGEAEKMNAILIGGTGATGRCMLGSLLQAKVSSNEMFLVGVRIGCKQTMVLGRVLGASLVQASMVHVAKGTTNGGRCRFDY